MSTALLGGKIPDTDPSIDEKGSVKSAPVCDVKIPPLGAPVDDVSGNPFTGIFKKNAAADLDAVTTQPCVFDDPTSLEAYRPPLQYENSHRFDPLVRWTWHEEYQVVRKIDLQIMIWTYSFLGDLGLTTNDYNLGNTLFRVSFLCAELPSQLVSKRIGPDVWVLIQMTLWSIVSLSQFWLSGRSSFLACRFLLGFMQGGFIPDIVLHLSYFYTKRELSIRMAYFWLSNYVADIISAFLGAGNLKMRGIGGKAGWRYLFLLEGIMTLCVGLASFYLMPAGPTQTRGWFSEREETIMVNRVLRDDPTKSDMHNREGLSVKMNWEAACDWRLWPIHTLGLVRMMPVGPSQLYLTLSLKNLGFDTAETNLLTIPSVVIGAVMLLATAYFSERVNSRVAATMILQIWALPLLVALYTFNKETSQWIYFAVVTLVTGFPYVHPIQVAWASRNSYSVRTRTVSASLYNMFVQAGAIVYANIYRKDDAPLYKRGNKQLIALTIAETMSGTHGHKRDARNTTPTLMEN